MAWAVLEDVALDAQYDERGELVAVTSARAIAAHLGVQPGTAARALRRLREAGSVTAIRAPGAQGRFGRSAYRLAPIVGVHVEGPHTEEPLPVAPPREGPAGCVVPRHPPESHPSAAAEEDQGTLW